MTKRETVAFIICLAIAVIYTGVVSIVGDMRISRLQDQVRELECRHVMFEDGSSLHKDAELVRICLGRKD